MLQNAGFGTVLLALLWGTGCGSGPPAEHDIWHTPALRPGQVPPTSAAERELLAQMPGLPSDEPVTVGGQVFVAGPPYAAASGRNCRTVTMSTQAAPSEASGARLACEQGADWVFVPDVLADGSW